jgi:hypothetical protein
LEWEDGRPWGGAAVDFTPGVDDIKGLIEVFTGCDIITGEDLGNWRWLGLLGVSELRKLRYADSLENLDELAVQPKHLGDNSGVFSDHRYTKYIYEPTEPVFAQYTSNTCASAACRMIAHSEGAFLEE